jgi:aminoglycoside phosphotransferase (APT) family kinase protein
MQRTDPRRQPSSEWIASLRARYPVERTIDQTLTRKLERRASGAAAKADLGDIQLRLERFLRARIEGPFTVANVAPLTGGASKEQFSFSLDWNCDGERRVGERMVLRREPAESVVETNRLREFQLLAAVDGLVPVPKAYWLDQSGADLGRPAMIYAYVDGVQKPSTGSSNVTGVGIQFDARQRAIIAPQFIGYLAKIHRFDPAGAGLSAFEMPRAGTTDDADWQINWWARVWQEDLFEAIPVVTLAEQWLRANRRPLDHVSLVHGDYRTGNYLFDDRSLRITAILDWELGYFGDRHFDLAWILMQTFETPGEDGRRLSSSLFPREEFIAAYRQATGLPVFEERIRYYTVLALWKGVILTLGTALRAADGSKSHQDVILTWFAGLGYTLMEQLRRALNEAGP